MTEGITTFTYTSLKEHDTAIRNAALDEVMEKIDYRFNDTERGRRTIETCREVIKSLRTKEQP